MKSFFNSLTSLHISPVFIYVSLDWINYESKLTSDILWQKCYPCVVKNVICHVTHICVMAILMISV